MTRTTLSEALRDTAVGSETGQTRRGCASPGPGIFISRLLAIRYNISLPKFRSSS